MGALLVLKPGVNWRASGGLFDWTLEFLMCKVDDLAAVDHLREIVDNNLGTFWLTDLSPPARQQVVTQLRSHLVDAGRRDLPPGEHKAAALRHLEELAALTHELD